MEESVFILAVEINSRYRVNELGPLCLWQCMILIYLLIKLVEVVDNNGDGEGDTEDATDGTS